MNEEKREFDKKQFELIQEIAELDAKRLDKAIEIIQDVAEKNPELPKEQKNKLNNSSVMLNDVKEWFLESAKVDYRDYEKAKE